MTDCSKYEGASTVNFAFSVAITVGIIVSYLPQYRRIYVKRTSEGLSSTFLLLGSSSSIFTLTNIILISSDARKCCYNGSLSAFNCLNSQLNMIQIGVQCTCAILILVFVLLWTKHSVKQDRDEYARIVKVGSIVNLHALASLVQILVGLYGGKSTLYSIANANGLLSTALTVIKYVPQIWTTYNLKHPGTLSVGMMCIQTPGGFVFAATLFFTKGSHWSSWISYLVAALLQGTLLILCLYYEYFDHSGVGAQMAERAEIERIVAENEREDIAADSQPAA
ncbi:hypothetical protein DICA3_F10044 [Diutina catenulata]